MKLTYSKMYVECDLNTVDVFTDGIKVGELVKDRYAGEYAEYYFQHVHHGSMEEQGATLKEAKRCLPRRLGQWAKQDPDFWRGTYRPLSGTT